MSSVQNNSGVYVIVNNIPKVYRSNQLRYFFSSFVESGGFICFHYIHRPGVQKPLSSTNSDERRKKVSYCCIVKVVADRVHELIETYNGQHWKDGYGTTLRMCCFIKEMKFSDNDNSIHNLEIGCRLAIPKKAPIDHEKLSINEVESLSEMRPPSFMPNGNVGTTIKQLLKEIHMRRLKPHVIRRLTQQFPRSWAMRNCNVAFDYKSKRGRLKSKSNISNSKPVLGPSFHNRYWQSQVPVECSYREDGYYKEILYPEEKQWKRYAALHDVYEQERLFQEEIAMNWKKGRSDLVFNSDGPYWDAREGYFDANISQDWDIDTRIYGRPDYRWAIPYNLPADYGEFPIQEMEPLFEMCPPSFMPNGNVETTADNFFEEICVCRLPPDVIHKVGLKLPKSRTRRMYRKFKKNKMNLKKIYEQLWAVREGYFDAETSDDLGINTCIYEEPAPKQLFYCYKVLQNSFFTAPKQLSCCSQGINNDKDNNLVEIKEKDKNDTEVEVDLRYEFAGFEKYNKGIGRKILEAQGWRQGQGIGKNAAGIAEPLPNEGQVNKKGFGYHGVMAPPKKRKHSNFEEKAVSPSTICNDRTVSDPPESSLASSFDAKLKYQQKFLKETK